MTLAERIAALREDRGWSRRLIAVNLGVTEQTVINWERGAHRPQADKIRGLERLYGVSLKEVDDEK